MNDDEQISSELDTIVSVKTSKLLSLCKVCGIDGAQMHYGGICCVSCKIFFRRNSHFDLNTQQCVFNEKCFITINSRRACRYCRLQKCLSTGMQRELLRASHKHQDISKMKSNENILSLPNVISSLDLLCNDRSLLTDEQWCRLSNIINVHNSKSPVYHIRYLLSTQSKHPMKIRLKMAKTNLLEIILSTYQAIFPFLETLPEFQTMQHNEKFRSMS